MSHCANRLCFLCEGKGAVKCFKIPGFGSECISSTGASEVVSFVQNERIRGLVRGQEFTRKSLRSSHKIFNSASYRQH